jgi:hypothetical protein
MSSIAVATKEMPPVGLGTLDDRFLRGEGLDAPPEPTPVDIDVKITGPDSVAFTLQHPVEGVSIPEHEPSTIYVSKPNATLSLRLHLNPASGYTFHENPILWVDPPQKGYGSDPFGTQPIRRDDPWAATIPNATGPKGSPKLETPFALVLEDLTLASRRTVVIDPTIVDEPNT